MVAPCTEMGKPKGGAGLRRKTRSLAVDVSETNTSPELKQSLVSAQNIEGSNQDGRF